MPGTYMHKKFGSLVYKELPKKYRNIIKKGMPSFLLGLHGPDVLFFYHPIPGVSKSTADLDLGGQIHHAPMKKFHEHAVKVLNRKSNDDMLAYYLGCICHFYLDSEIHPLVSDAMEKTGLSHGKIESELEKYALAKDSHYPLTYKTQAHLSVLPSVAKAAAAFYPGITDAEMLQMMATMKSIYAVCNTDNTQIRKGIVKVMQVTKNEGKVASLLKSKDKSMIAYSYTKEMYSKMFEAVPWAVLEIIRLLDADTLPGASKRMELDFLGE